MKLSRTFQWILIPVILILLLLTFVNIVALDRIEPYNLESTRVDINDIIVYTEEHFTDLNEAQLSSLIDEQLDNQYAITVIDLMGKVQYTNKDETIQKVVLQEALYFDHYYTTQNNNIYKAAYPIVSNESALGYVLIETSLDSLIIEDYIKKSQHVKIYIGTVIILLSLWFGLHIIKQKLEKKQQKRIIDLINRVAIADFDIKQDPKNRIDKKTFSALKTLTDELKYLLDEEQKYRDMQQKFIAMISHELKTPIALIKAYGEALRDGVSNTESDREKYIKIIIDKADKLAYQTDEIFKITLKELNQFKFKFEEKYADDVIRDIFEPIKEKYTEKQAIEVSYDIPRSLINVDVIRFEQAIINLLDNAIKHNSGGNNIVLKAWANETNLTVLVADKGEGIKPKDLPYIFQYFYQGSHKEVDHKGSGLGLGICKHIIDEHKGEIYVESTENEGSKFYLELPFV